jgi:transcriptional regulator with XRE-family HTH domain
MEKVKYESIALGVKLKEFRKSILDVSQNEFAEMLHTTQANVSQIESEQCIPSGSFLLKLAETYPQINMNWIFFNEGNPFRENTVKKKSKVNKKKELESMMLNLTSLNKKIGDLLK